MDKSKPAIDLEKELTCSICTELLYQPLTLLDCLHTYCGACLKEWFSWQAQAAESHPGVLDPNAPIFTCPSCRAPVRDTRHNATVATLLEMFLAANPDKNKTEVEKAEALRNYKPGDKILPKIKRLEDKTPEEQQEEEEDRRMLEQVRELSLRETIGLASGSRASGARTARGRTEESRDRRAREARARTQGRDRDHRTRRYASPEHNDTARHRPSDPGLLRPDDDRHRQRGSRSRSRQPSTESSESRRQRQVEHQSSLRSLISSSGGITSREIEQEIEDFARQIREEGLLDGLDLDNMVDLHNNDEFMRKITDAYRRRQRERSRLAAASRRHETASTSISHRSEMAGPRGTRSGSHSRPVNRQRPQSRPAPSSRREGVNDERRASPPHLEVHHHEPDARRRRPRRMTHGESETHTRPRLTLPDNRTTSRSQIDLALAPPGPSTSETRSSSSPPLGSTEAARLESSLAPSASPSLAPTSQATQVQGDDSPGRQEPLTPFDSRAAGATDLGPVQPQTQPQPSSSQPQPQPQAQPPLQPAVAVTESDTERTEARLSRPTRIVTSRVRSASHSSPPNVSAISNTVPSYQTRSVSIEISRQQTLYPEPSITCARCQKGHIEYELHYHCASCRDGQWYLCLDCYRGGKGCLHWFGFGYIAWVKWHKSQSLSRDPQQPQSGPHMLTANRFCPPKAASFSGEKGGVRLTGDDPSKRLQSGCFCARCLAWANECYWRCDICNYGDWGFCTDCMNQGRTCIHALLPLAYHPDLSTQDDSAGATTAASSALANVSSSSSGSPPRRAAPPIPASASFLRGLCTMAIGPFRPLSFSPRCGVCRSHIPPLEHRYHCPTCPSFLNPGRSGEYQVCQPCYGKLVADGRISAENGPAGWRRCPRGGHRMTIVAFAEDEDGRLRRLVVRDLVGGWRLQVHREDDFCSDEITSPSSNHNATTYVWSWYDETTQMHLHRLVSHDVHASTIPPAGSDADSLAASLGLAQPGRHFTDTFPSDGGTGMRATARWAWYPKAGAHDELLMPLGAEVREIEDVNGDWFHGIYMGNKGLFPAPYVQVLRE